MHAAMRWPMPATEAPKLESGGSNSREKTPMLLFYWVFLPGATPQIPTLVASNLARALSICGMCAFAHCPSACIGLVNPSHRQNLHVSPAGPEDLADNKRVIVAISRGGI